MASPDQQRGFTLVEILVVLVLTGMIAGILLQGMQQVFFLQRHFDQETFQSQQGVMRADWFRSTINGLIPDHQLGTHKFRGQPNQLTGLTTNPLVAHSGVLLPFVLNIVFDKTSGESGLYYGDEASQTPILSWTGENGAFRYLDHAGEIHTQWPPPLGQWPQLPAAVFLDTGLDQTQRIFVAAPKGPTTPELRRQDL